MCDPRKLLTDSVRRQIKAGRKIGSLFLPPLHLTPPQLYTYKLCSFPELRLSLSSLQYGSRFTTNLGDMVTVSGVFVIANSPRPFTRSWATLRNDRDASHLYLVLTRNNGIQLDAARRRSKQRRFRPNAGQLLGGWLPFDGLHGDDEAYLHFTPGDTLLFSSIAPTSAGAIFGACLILFLVAVGERALMALNRGFDRQIKTRSQRLLLTCEFANNTAETGSDKAALRLCLRAHEDDVHSLSRGRSRWPCWFTIGCSISTHAGRHDVQHSFSH
ncbi:hypothetical protein MIND_01396500 [Mycena indigotica]|uniref:Copper transport protein n=1 Tax=Mycena indigotica TaxID=2126181 RepID=A0A8H6S121_9AGAR|nr:uncharacterized protein MIND_01396500 [Mycena indigotica]KAF7289345.1 hypothetical protein MIND_01396500 [Mycena indigotica]